MGYSDVCIGNWHCQNATITELVYSDPGIIKIFEQIWGTDDLIASFDGMNVSLPINPETGRTDIEETCEL